MNLKEIIKELQRLIHDKRYDNEDKYHMAMAHNALMKVFEKETKND